MTLTAIPRVTKLKYEGGFKLILKNEGSSRLETGWLEIRVGKKDEVVVDDRIPCNTSLSAGEATELLWIPDPAAKSFRITRYVGHGGEGSYPVNQGIKPRSLLSAYKLID